MRRSASGFDPTRSFIGQCPNAVVFELAAMFEVPVTDAADRLGAFLSSEPKMLGGRYVGSSS